MPRYLLSTILTALIVNVSLLAQNQSFSVIYNLTGAPDGAYPYAGLFRDAVGNLYGTTIMGGTGTCYNGSVHGCGTVFKVDLSGNETVIHNFVGGSDGAYPWASLVGDSSGNLYGTTLEGGSFSAGTVFKLDSNGQETILHNFSGVPDGANPYGAVIRDATGNLYGATSFGGDASCGASGGCGTVYKLNADGSEQVLYGFKGGADGLNPYGSLSRDPSGNLYGATYGGGTGCLNGCGTVYKIDVHGNETILYAFQGGTDGSGPEAGPIRDSSGNLYGTTALGGGTACQRSGCGTVYRLDSSGNESILYSFNGRLDGALPNASLLRDPAGNLYGTTFQGGGGFGGVFKITSTGNFRVLYYFRSGTGAPYFAALIRDPAGTLYGTTMGAGQNECVGGCGAVFKINSY